MGNRYGGNWLKTGVAGLLIPVLLAACAGGDYGGTRTSSRPPEVGTGSGAPDTSTSNSSRSGPVRFDEKMVLLDLVRAQKTDSWCWAASGAMIMRYHGATLEQCNLVDGKYGPGCHCEQCDDPDPNSVCIKGGWPDFQAFGFRSQFFTTNPDPHPDNAMPFAMLKAELDAGRPVAFSWAWEGGGGHMMVAAGYGVREGREYVWVLDPLDPCDGSAFWVRYSSWVRRSGEYEHWRDEFGIEPDF